MNVSADQPASGGPNLRSGIPFLAAAVALVGLIDSAYLTVMHGEKVPCSLVEGCDKVLTSEYSEIFGVPTALFGVAAYFAAFALAILAAFGNGRMWTLFGVQSSVMLVAAVWLVYLQAFVIGAFCQFCLLSALTTTILFLIFIGSRIFPAVASKH
jgi:uncharacterized membrane protein